MALYESCITIIIIICNSSGRYRASVLILGSSLRSLGLHSLTSVLYGRVLMGDNGNLCFANTINWSRITNNRPNAFNLQDDYSRCSKYVCRCQS